MSPEVLRFFAKAAAEMQLDRNIPHGYVVAKIAAAQKFPGLFKVADNPYVELAGLGTLAAPSVQHLRGKPMKEDNSHKMELAGLGILAAPYAHEVAMKTPVYRNMAGRVGSFFRRV